MGQYSAAGTAHAQVIKPWLLITFGVNGQYPGPYAVMGSEKSPLLMIQSLPLTHSIPKKYINAMSNGCSMP